MWILRYSWLFDLVDRTEQRVVNLLQKLQTMNTCFRTLDSFQILLFMSKVYGLKISQNPHIHFIKCGVPVICARKFSCTYLRDLSDERENARNFLGRNSRSSWRAKSNFAYSHIDDGRLFFACVIKLFIPRTTSCQKFVTDEWNDLKSTAKKALTREGCLSDLKLK